MPFISTKTIKEKKRYYLEKSVRLLDGTIKKCSVYLKDYLPTKRSFDLAEYKERLEQQVKSVMIDAASHHYKRSFIFTPETLQRLEEIRLGYKKVIKKLTASQLRDVLDRFTVNFTYESNAIEGNSLTLKDVTMILKEGKIVKGKDLREVYETINTRKAIDWIFSQPHRVNEKTIIKLHALLIRDTGVAEGYKQLPNFLLGRNLQTAPPEKVREEMVALLREYEQNAHLHPLQRAAIFHGKFEKIHPFEDGNGRVGRLLINIMLLRHDYPPLIIKKTQRIKYFHALEAFDKGHPENLYRFLIQKYKDTYKKFFQVYVKYL